MNIPHQTIQNNSPKPKARAHPIPNQPKTKPQIPKVGADLSLAETPALPSYHGKMLEQ